MSKSDSAVLTELLIRWPASGAQSRLCDKVGGATYNRRLKKTFLDDKITKTNFHELKSFIDY